MAAADQAVSEINGRGIGIAHGSPCNRMNFQIFVVGNQLPDVVTSRNESIIRAAVALLVKCLTPKFVQDGGRRVYERMIQDATAQSVSVVVDQLPGSNLPLNQSQSVSVVEIEDTAAQLVPVVGDQLPNLDLPLNQSQSVSVVEIGDTSTQSISFVGDQLPDRDLPQNQSQSVYFVEIEDTTAQSVSVVGDQLSDAVTSRIKLVIQEAIALMEKFVVPRGEDGEQRVVELGNVQVVIQVTVALFGGSLAMMVAVPGGVSEVGRAVMGDTIAFNVFLVADTVAFHASLAVCIIVATVKQRPAKMEHLIRITLWGAAACLVLTFHAAAYVVVLPSHHWIVLCSGGAVTMMLLVVRLPCSTKFGGQGRPFSQG